MINSIGIAIKFIFALMLPLSSFAMETFPRPVISSDRKFIKSASVPVVVIKGENFPFEIVLSERAQKNCLLNSEYILNSLGPIVASKGDLWVKLDLMFPNSRNQVQDLNVKLFIDDFSDYIGNNPAFTSFFVKMGSDRVIGLNCNGPSRFYWPPSLAHELIHVLFSTKNVESWWEEGIAQNMESEMGGRQPVLTVKHFNDFANLQEIRRPLPNKSSYAINQLFMRYLRFQFGGWPLLQKMSEEHQIPECESQSDFFEKIMCRGRGYLNATPAGKKFTRAGVLRYFAVALTLNDPKSLYYSIPGWGGVELAPNPQLDVLQPGQFVAWTDIQLAKNVNPNFEVYRIVSDGDGNFVIAPRERIYDETWIQAKNPSIKKIQKDFILVLNLQQTLQAIF